MSEIKVNSIKGVGASAAAITVNNTDGTATANLTNRQNRNLIINGAMQVSQRSVSSTTSGYGSIDRFSATYGGTDEAITHSQINVAPTEAGAGTAGFRNAFRIQNGNQTSGFGTTDYIQYQQIIEDQNIANSGWIVNDPNSFITVSYWIRSSVAQQFFGFVETSDGADWMYGWTTGVLTANVWTKITKTIPGRSNLSWSNDNGHGLLVAPVTLWGTDRTDPSVGNDVWHAYSGSARTPDATSTWWTTNDATIDITGVQVEVGSVATDFEHRSFGQELALCQRYYQQYVNPCITGATPDNGSKAYSLGLQFQTRMRAVPTLTIANAGNGGNVFDGSSNQSISSLNAADRNVDGASIYLNLAGDLNNFRPACTGLNDSTTHTTTYKFTAEL